MMLVKTYLSLSSIEGLGVFTAEPIAKGQNCWRLDTAFDRLIPVAEVARAPQEMQIFLDRYGYTYAPDPDYIVLDVDDGRYMNHADRPNLNFSDQVNGIATRDIAAGEELTCDYRTFTVGEIIHLPPRMPADARKAS
ncbi:MAG: SET domain-containing protein-lysine N-methyltransferase [Parvularcula sp.]|jgi:SET domain-containing protein|nr:SET domain-containing protein-lysine N-methyltransferase [Parvularcula sp.]